MNAVGEEQPVWTATTGWWNPDDPLVWSQNRGVLWHKYAFMWSACEVGVIGNTNLQLRMCLLRAPFPGTIAQIQQPCKVSSGGVAAPDLASPCTGPKHGETLHTFCHIFTRNNPKATAPIQVCNSKLPYFFMDPVWWRPRLCSLMLDL